jgi:hypothetical protein
MSDLSPKYGTLAKGLYGSARAVVQFIILPIFLILVSSSLLEGLGNESWEDLGRELIGMKMLFAAFGSVLAFLSFFYEFYPAGSASRLLFGQIRALVIIALGYMLLVGSGLHDAAASAGLDVDLVSLFFLFVVLVGLGMLYLMAEWFDSRWTWRRSKAVIDGTPFPAGGRHVQEDPKAHRPWHDFRLRYGRMAKGVRMARGAMVRYVILPIGIIIVSKAVISYFGDTMTGMLTETLATTMSALFLVGVPIAFMSFFKGFYPKGSLSRMTFSIIIVALLDLWIWYATLQGHFQADLDMVDVDLNYQPYVILIISGVSLWALYYLVELASYRKDWISQDFHPVDEGKASERRMREKALRKAGKSKQRS